MAKTNPVQNLPLTTLVKKTPNKPTTPGTKPAKSPPATPLKKVPIYVQPDFDPRLTKSLSAPFFSGVGADYGIRRGFMVWDNTVPAPDGYDKKEANYPARVRFLFNPSTISTSYQVATGQAQAAMMYGSTAGLDNSLLLPMQQQASFTLMFDRTYELNDSGASTDMKNFGVDMDIAALRQYTGMYAGIYTQGQNSNANFSDPNSSNTQQSTSGTARKNPNQVNKWVGPTGSLSQGVMQVTLGFIYFSGPTSTAVGGNGYGLSYYGYIDSWSVEYTHFTRNMIPQRAVVDISFTFLPPPTTAPDPKAASTIAKQQLVGPDLAVFLPGKAPTPITKFTNPTGTGTAGR